VGYTKDKPPLPRPTSELRDTIPGWGVDLDPKNRPAVPKEHFNPGGTGAHWDFPERQVPRWPRERSPEHKFLTPVFGTACPPKGLSGMIRRYAYRFSEGRLKHWLLLMGADRVDVVESRIQAVMEGRPDSRIAETGIRSEFTRHGWRSRFGRHRADLRHQWIDVLMFAAPYIATGCAIYSIRRSIANRHASSEA
jgi:hypothetical protein